MESCPVVFYRAIIFPSYPARMRFDLLFPPFSTNLDSIIRRCKGVVRGWWIQSTGGHRRSGEVLREEKSILALG